MSCYEKHKVLRIPFDKIDLSRILNKCKELDENYQDDFSYALEQAFPELFQWNKRGYFQLSPTSKQFMDYVINTEYDSEGEYGKTRDLYPSEQQKYLPKFQLLDPNINMQNVKLVEYCWYNGTEAPDYYDKINDPFYEEV